MPEFLEFQTVIILEPFGATFYDDVPVCVRFFYLTDRLGGKEAWRPIHFS